MRGIEIQFRTRSRIRATRGGKALMFGFNLGPVCFYVIANMPNSNREEEEPLVYIKITIRSDAGWQMSPDHSAESSNEADR